MPDPQARPFPINRDTGGSFHLTVRDSYQISLGYMLVKVARHDQLFKAAATAKTLAHEYSGAKVGRYATKSLPTLLCRAARNWGAVLGK